MKKFLFPKPVIPQVVSMVGCKNDHGLFQQFPFFQEIHKSAEMIVNFCDQPHVGRNDRFPHLIPGEVDALLVLHECSNNRMGILLFMLLPVGS